MIKNKIRNLLAYKIEARFQELINIVFVMGILLFGISIPFEWFIFDDHLHILGNEQLKDFSIKGLLYFWTDATSKIPITYHVWQILAAIFGIHDPAPYRLVNILLHSINSILVYYFIQKLWTLLNNKKSKQDVYLPAFLSALFFLVHPVQVESVVWISSLKGVLSSFFSLISLCYYLKTIEKPEQTVKYVVLMTVSLGLAVTSKPSAVVVPLIYFFLDSFLFKIPLIKSLIKNTHILFLGILFTILQTVEYSVERASVSFPFHKQIVMVPATITKYLQLVFFPNDLKFNYQYNYSWIDEILTTDHFSLRMHLIVALIFFWLIIFLSFFRKGKYKLLSFSLIFFITTISVNIGIVYYEFMSISTVADRYLYFPIIGFALLLAFIPSYLNDRSQWLFNKGMIVTLIILSALSFKQIFKWKNNVNYLLAEGDDMSELNSNVVMPLIGDLFNKQKYQKAFEVFSSHEKRLGEEGAFFISDFLKVFGEKRLYHMKHALDTLADINQLTLDQDDVFRYYLASEQFVSARDYLEQSRKKMPLFSYKMKRKQLREQWSKRRIAAIGIKQQILEEYDLENMKKDFLSRELAYFKEHDLEEERIEEIALMIDDQKLKEKIRQIYGQKGEDAQRKFDKVKELLKAYHVLKK